jgi:hypothetical protein
MSTFVELQTRIADEMDDDDLKSGGQIAKAVNSAIQEYRDRRLWFTQIKAKTFSLTSGTEYVAPVLSVTGISTTEPLTTVDLLKIDDGSGANYRALVQVDDSVIEAAQGGAVIGRPSHFSLVSDSTGTRIRFYPIPDQNYTPSVTGMIRFSDLSLDADTNSWLTDGEELIRQSAKRKLMADVTHELPPGSPPTAAEQVALSALYKTTRLRMGSPQVRTEVAGMQGASYGVNADIRNI